MSAEDIKENMVSFQDAVRSLSEGIGKAAPLWKDEKFAELSASVSEVANNSRDVLMSGDKCCTSIYKFDKIAEESC